MIQSERRDSVRNAEIHEQFTGVDVGKEAIERVARAGGACIVGRFEMFRQEFAERKRHRIAEKKRSDNRQDNVTRYRVAGASSRELFDAVVAHDFYQSVHRDKQDNQRRNDFCAPRAQNATPAVEKSDEGLRKTYHCVHKNTLLKKFIR